MRGSKTLRLLGAVATRAEAADRLRSPGDAILVERGRPRLLLLACPCGCGDEFPINLDSRADKAWRLYRDAKRGLTLYPSVWRDTGCESHFIIWRDRIYVFRSYEDDLDEATETESTAQLLDVVRGRLSRTTLTSFFDIAEELGAIPWDVLLACRRLVRMRVALEGKGDDHGSFGLV